MSDDDLGVENATLVEETRAQLELRHLRYFLAVAEHLNFRQAAAQLGVAQPALSLQVQALERIVGARLFDRTSRSVRLSQAGHLFKREAEQTLQQADRARLVAQRAGRGELGRIVIAYAASTLFTGVLSSAVHDFHRRYPEVNIEVEELGIEEQLEQLDRGTIDAGILRLPLAETPASITILPVLREPIMLVASRDHWLATRDGVDIAELAGQAIISSQTDKVGILRQVVEAARERGFSPEIVRARHFGAIVGLASAGLGVGTVTESAQALQLPSVIYRPLKGVDQSQVALAARADEEAPPVLAFMEIVRALAPTWSARKGPNEGAPPVAKRRLSRKE